MADNLEEKIYEIISLTSDGISKSDLERAIFAENIYDDYGDALKSLIKDGKLKFDDEHIYSSTEDIPETFIGVIECGYKNAHWMVEIEGKEPIRVRFKGGSRKFSGIIEGDKVKFSLERNHHGNEVVARIQYVCKENIKNYLSEQFVNEALPNSLYLEEDNDFSNYTVLTDLDFITIDNKSTKLRDDAIYAVRNSDGGYKIKIAVADVAHYVRPESDEDLAAKQLSVNPEIGHGVRSLPVLWELYKKRISLDKGIDRRALVYTFNMDKVGRINSSSFERAVIRSNDALSFGRADEFYNSKDKNNLSKKVIQTLASIKGATDILHAKAIKCKGQGGGNGNARDLKYKMNGDAPDSNRMVELLMRLPKSVIGHKIFAKMKPNLDDNYYQAFNGKTLKHDFSAAMGYLLSGDEKKANVTSPMMGYDGILIQRHIIDMFSLGNGGQKLEDVTALNSTISLINKKRFSRNH